MALLRPFTVFNFKVNLKLENSASENNANEMENAGPGKKIKTLCEAEFSECDGLEMSMEPKSIREGGNNFQQIHLAGPVSYGQLTLKRGMTANFDLWTWFEKVQQQRNLRASGDILLLSSFSKQQQERATEVKFSLTGCLPLKIKAPSFNAKDGLIAIEEMQIAYETLIVSRPGS